MDYKNGKIYSIRSYQTKNVYIGSTTQPLTKRLSLHKTKFNSWISEKAGYVSSYEIIQYDDSYIELIEQYPCKNRSELLKREGEIIRNSDDVVNKMIPGRTKKEYYNDNKDKKQQYYNDNKEKILLKAKDYYIINKDKILKREMNKYNSKKESTKDIIL